MRGHGQVNQRLFRFRQPQQHRAEQVIPFRAARGDAHQQPARVQILTAGDQLFDAP